MRDPTDGSVVCVALALQRGAHFGLGTSLEQRKGAKLTRAEFHRREKHRRIVQSHPKEMVHPMTIILNHSYIHIVIYFIYIITCIGLH